MSPRTLFGPALLALVILLPASSAPAATTCRTDADCAAAETCSPDGVCSCAGIVCGDGAACCDDPRSGGPTCVSVSDDERHCGTCFNTCGSGEECIQGECACFVSETEFETCGAGQSCCPGFGGCTDTGSDPSNCGFCGNRCGAGETCETGSCSCGDVASEGPACSADGACCGSPPVCVVGTADPCGCGSTTCPAGTECCDVSQNLCADLQNDDENCGACGNVCGPSMTCSSGGCRCEPGFADCDGDPANGCEVALGSDDRACGACGNACPGGSSCVSGACRPNCPPGQTACQLPDGGNTCVDTLGDSRNCGFCGNVCAPGTRCEGGSCAPDCGFNQAFCSGSCVDVDRDEAHCGACGEACAPGELCVEGRCETSCQAGLVLCDGLCTNTGSDADHCGACGQACEPGTTCEAGRCQITCQEDLALCGSTCTNTASDREHCGGCNLACAEGQICSEGVCRGLEIDRSNMGPVLYVPLWRIENRSSQLVVHKPGGDSVRVNASFVDAEGNLVAQRSLALDFPVAQTETIDLDAMPELAKVPEGAVLLVATHFSAPGEPRFRPWIGAELWMVDDKTMQLDRIEALNARSGVWTTFADVWSGPVENPAEDEILVFCPSNDLAGALHATGELPGNPALGFADEVHVELRDRRGTVVGEFDLPCTAVTSFRASDHVNARDLANVTLRPVLSGSPDDPDHRQDVVFLGMTYRTDAAATSPKKVKKGSSGAAYLFSIPGGTPKTPLPPCPTGVCP